MESQPLLKQPMDEQPSAPAPPGYTPSPAYGQPYGAPPPPQPTAPHAPVYHTAPPPPSTVVVTQQQTHISAGHYRFGEFATQIRCPNCQKDVVTQTYYETGMLTWLLVGLLFILGFWLCCWIPLIIDSAKDVVHTCPNCRHTCGVYKRM